MIPRRHYTLTNSFRFNFHVKIFPWWFLQREEPCIEDVWAEESLLIDEWRRLEQPSYSKDSWREERLGIVESRGR